MGRAQRLRFRGGRPAINNTADMVHFASDAAFAFTSDCRLVAWNARAEDLFGYTAQEVVGRSCYQVLRAVLPDGQPLCTPSCPAIACFGRG